jgi:membrane protease YdiL (CAAX protease family)
LIWACWHLPLFYTTAPIYRQAFPMFVLAVAAISTAITWLYVNTNGSLLPATLMHWATNQAGRFMPAPPTKGGDAMAFSASSTEWAAVALMWIAAAYFLMAMRRFDSSRDDFRPGELPAR